MRVTAKTTLDVLVKPYTFPIKLLRGGYAKRVEITRDGAKALVGYLIYGLVPGSFTLSIAEFHSQTDDDFLNISKDQIMVIVDGFEDKSFLDRNRKVLINILAEEKRREGWNVIYISPQNASDLAVQLNEIRRRYGRIARIDIYTHGSAVSGMVVNSDWVGKNNGNSKFYNNLEPGIMEDNAVVRINACNIGKNTQILTDFGKALMPRGGRVYASKLITVPSGTAELTEYLAHKEMPSVINRVQDLLVGRAFNFGLLFYLQGQNFYDSDGWLHPEWNPIQKVDIP